MVENALGILAARFRCLLTMIPFAQDRVANIILTCCVLHNLLRHRNPHIDIRYIDREDRAQRHILPGDWRQHGQLRDNDIAHAQRAADDANVTRRYMIDYVNTPHEAVPWQNDII